MLWFGVHLTDHCDLNCKCCDNFSPIADEKYLDVETFIRDCRRISELTSKRIAGMNLLGGEPLLHPNIIEIMTIARNYFLNCPIRILTNGILLLKQPDEFWDCCRTNAIDIQVTKYPIKLDFDKIEQKAKEQGVEYFYTGNAVTAENAELKEMWCIPLCIDGHQNARKNFFYCYKSNVCTALEDGKIFPCETIARIHYFNKYFGENLIVSESDYVDIYKVKTIDEILQWLTQPVPFCKYCDIKNIRRGIKWDISKKEMSEWV